MIQTRTDLKKFLFEDKRANIYAYGGGHFCYLKHCLGNTDAYRVYKYLKSLRYYEYWLNKSNLETMLFLRSIYTIITGICKVRLSRRSAKYNINVCRPNTIGYGFRITHINGGVIINCERMGNYCVANSGVVVGVRTGVEKAPIIGNCVELATGCKVIGNVVVGDNAIVAPNSVVVKDVEPGTVVSGIPAKFLKEVSKK